MTIDISVIALLVTILLTLFGVVFGYGILTNKVAVHGKDIEKLESSYKSIDDKLDIICDKVARIEAAIKERDRKEAG